MKAPKIEIVTPQFTRERGAVQPAAPPSDWNALSQMNMIALKELGLRAWNDPKESDDEFDGRVLMLFPGEWYLSIPEGFEITSISGATEVFERGESDDDIRFGCLPYGITVVP